MKRIPTLDGWRGIAILLVLFDHIEHSFHAGYPHPWMQTGQHGVTIFFVLSGFLITSKLLADRSEGPIELKRFYIRRFFRLIPVAWTYLAVLVLLSWTFHTKLITAKELWACLFFYRNFINSVGLAGHFWSLSLEEQFYLIWPAVLLIAGTRKSLRIATSIAAVSAIAIACYRWNYWAHYDNLARHTESQVRADALLIGCLVALLLSYPEIRATASRWSRYWAMPALLVLIGCIPSFHWLPPLFECLAIAGLIAASTLHPDAIAARPLSSTPLVMLGVVSYSVYIWQALFMFEWSPALHLILLCLGLPLIVLGSYYGIEKPMTRFGHRLTSEPQPALYDIHKDP